MRQCLDKTETLLKSIINQNKLFFFSWPEPNTHWWAYRIGRPPSSIVVVVVIRKPHSWNIFSSETSGPIKVIFHMELLWDGGTKVCSNGRGHMTKMAVTKMSGGERGGSVVECRTPEREVGGWKPTAAVLCPWARHFTPRKYWLITQQAVASSRHDWKIVDWDVKPQHKQTNKMSAMPIYGQNLQNLLLWNQKADDLHTWYAASGAQVLPSLFKWCPWVDLDLFYGKVKFGPLCFCIGKKLKQWIFQKLL